VPGQAGGDLGDDGLTVVGGVIEEFAVAAPVDGDVEQPFDVVRAGSRTSGFPWQAPSALFLRAVDGRSGPSRQTLL
jgi:hypothetical protein